MHTNKRISCNNRTRAEKGRVAASLILAAMVCVPLAQAHEVAECTASVAVAHAILPMPPAPPAPVSSMTPFAAPAMSVLNAFRGRVSYYGRGFAGRLTAAGERFNPGAMTMAHKTLPFGAMVRVTNLLNNMSVVVRVNDRGPFTGGRVGDLSAGAANALGMLGAGVVDAVLEVLDPGKPPER